MPAATHLADLIGRIEEQLGRFGVAGQVELDGSRLWLTGRGGRIAIELTEIDAWTGASPALQDRIVDRIVRKVVRARREHNPSTSQRSHWFEWLRPVAVVVLAGVGIWSAWKLLGRPARDSVVAMAEGRHPSAIPPTGTAVAHDTPTASARAAENCLRVQARIATGGNVSLLDVDGWVVELTLLSEDPAFGPASPKLDAFLAQRADGEKGRRMIWVEDEDLRATDAAGSFVVVDPEPLVDVMAGTKAGVKISWAGKFVGKYFSETGRVRMQRLAAAMYEATGAKYGGLYSRCVVGSNHQVGSWFRGPDLSAAVLSMVATMGLYAEVAHIEGADPRTASPIEQRRAWDVVAERAKKLDRKRLTLALSEDGGMIASRPGHWVTVTFPFQDANRATRSSLRIARALGVAPHR